MKITEKDATRDAELIKKAIQRYKELEKDGVRHPAVSEQIDPDVKPEWFNEIKFKKAQEFAKKYFVSLYVSHLAGLLLVLQLPRGLAPLLAMGNHGSIPKLFRRYCSTQVHVKSWYEEDPFDPTTSAYKSVRQVRGMHQNVCRVMNSKTGRVIGESDNIWVSQYDMALTQWAFIGVAILHPEECGLHDVTDEDLDNLIFFWKVMGYLHGIEDRFNLCAEDIHVTRELFRYVWENVYKPVCVAAPHPAPTGYEMTKGIVVALRVFNPSVKWITFMKYWYKILEMPIEFKIESPRNRLRYKVLKFSLNTLMRISFTHWIFSSLFKRNQKWQLAKQKKTERKLKERFPDITYSNCPYGFNLDHLENYSI